jgi:IS5 family transposase
MKPKTPPRQKQGDFLYQDLQERLNPKAPPLLLAKEIPWKMFEQSFAPLYADFGRPASPSG